jgi:hypothetical protein
MLAKEARLKMYLSHSTFSRLITTMKDDIGVAYASGIKTLTIDISVV